MANTGKRPLDAINEPSIPLDEQTTLRISKIIHRKLRVIAANEGTTIMAVTHTVLEDYCQRYEAATGRPLIVAQPFAPQKSKTFR